MDPKAYSTRLNGPDEHAASAVLAWDGRLDNRNELLARLRGVLRDDTSNEAIVLAAYERWGIPGLGQLIGDWSAVIRDARRRAIVLASDYAGVRPLYYHRQPDAIAWSARLASLVEATGIDAIDEQHVAGFLTVGGRPTRTPYAGIYSVPPGHAICATATGTTRHEFWAPPAGNLLRYRDERRYGDELRALFLEATAVRLQAQGPVLAELSGGLDSSSVVCVATHLMRSGRVSAGPLTTVSYVHRGSLDVPFIRDVEAFCGGEGARFSTHHHPLISRTGVGEAMPEDSAPLHGSVAAMARRLGARVFLTGHNGDLAMGNWLDDSLQVAGSLRSLRIRRACHEALAWSRVLRVPLAWILSRAFLAALPSAVAPRAVYATGLSAHRNNDSSETSLLRAFSTRTGVAAPLSVFSNDWMQAPPERRKHFLALTMMRELRALQPPEAMQELDYTHPFAHRPLVEFLMNVPADVLCRPGQPRRLMRESFADFWPPSLRTRRSKSLFQSAWADALRPMALELLRTPEWHVAERGWVDRTSLTSRLERLTRGLGCNEAQLRQVIMLEYWLRNREQQRRSGAGLRTA